MGKFEDFSHRRFGSMEVIERAYKPNDKHTFWRCKCDCGKEFISRADAIKNYKVLSCGCYLGKINNLVGQTYNLLKVIAIDDEKTRQKGRAYFLCQCDCGNQTIVRGSQLLDGSAQSCGCLRSSGEQKIASILSCHNIKYSREYSFSDLKGDNKPLHFDFAVFNNQDKLSYLIEYNGLQHYKSIDFFGGTEAFTKRQQYDKKKQEYCYQHNIPLVIIDYNEKILEEKVIRKELLYE